MIPEQPKVRTVLRRKKLRIILKENAIFVIVLLALLFNLDGRRDGRTVLFLC